MQNKFYTNFYYVGTPLSDIGIVVRQKHDRSMTFVSLH
jgi:hypothetical protein